MMVPASGGDPTVVFKPTTETGAILFRPEFLPEDAGPGSVLASASDLSSQKFFILDIRNGRVRPLGDGRLATYSATGHIVFHRQTGGAGGLWAERVALRLSPGVL